MAVNVCKVFQIITNIKIINPRLKYFQFQVKYQVKKD